MGGREAMAGAAEVSVWLNWQDWEPLLPAPRGHQEVHVAPAVQCTMSPRGLVCTEGHTSRALIFIRAISSLPHAASGSGVHSENEHNSPLPQQGLER